MQVANPATFPFFPNAQKKIINHDKKTYMQHPKSENVLKVIGKLKNVLPMATRERHLDMQEGAVNNGSHPCGTTHCHGGWFAVAMGLHLISDYVDYNNGANKMAECLGFPNMIQLENWAESNEHLWGNEDGTRMFCNEDAFISPTRPDGAENLQHIIDHWTEVYERLVALENKNNRVGITTSLAVLPPEERSDVVAVHSEKVL